MDSTGWILIVLIIGVIAVLIYLNTKSKASLEDEMTEPVPESKPPVMPIVTDSGLGVIEEKYVSIYEYSTAKNMKRCPCCDGENVYGAKICHICGNDIES